MHIPRPGERASVDRLVFGALLVAQQQKQASCQQHEPRGPQGHRHDAQDERGQAVHRRSAYAQKHGPRQAEWERQASRLGGKTGRPGSPTSSPKAPAPPWPSPAEVAFVPVAGACGSPKGQIEGTEVGLGPKEGSDNGGLGERVLRGGAQWGSLAGQG